MKKQKGKRKRWVDVVMPGAIAFGPHRDKLQTRAERKAEVEWNKAYLTGK